MTRSSPRDRRPRSESEGGKVVLFLVLGLGMLAGALYVAAYLGASDKVPVGTRVSGVDIGGQTPAAAVSSLRSGLAGRAHASFTVGLNGHTVQVRPRQVGLGVDYVASVRAAGAEQSWSLTRLWDYYTSGEKVDAVVTLDQLRLEKFVKNLSASDGRTPVDGNVVFRGGGFRVLRPVSGLALDPKATGQAFWTAFLTDDPIVQLRPVPSPPSIDVAEVDRFVKHFANPAESGPVELRFGKTTLRIAPSDYSRLLRTRKVDGHLRPEVDSAGLDAVVQQRLSEDGGPSNAPVDATVALVDGRPQIVKARPGVTFRPNDVGTALLEAIRSKDRSARVPASLAPAPFGNADARKLGIHDQISWFTLDLPQGSPSQRLIAAAVKLDNTVLKPGDSLSLRGRLGEATPEGARGAALATGLFNAAWKAGLPIGSHVTMPSYTGQYPLGRDAGLQDGQDLTFTNDTDHGVLVSVVAGRPTADHAGSLSVSLWSTEEYIVTSAHGVPSAVVPAGTVVRHGAQCTPRDGQNGFDVDVSRSVVDRETGQSVSEDSFTAHYEPRDAVECARRHHHHHHHHHHHQEGGR